MEKEQNKRAIRRSIPVNIWDDYYDDGHIPDGEKQKSYIYVEDRTISLDEQKRYLEYLLDYINNNIKLSGVKMWTELYDSKIKYPHINEIDSPQILKIYPNFHYSRWEIKIEDFPHLLRETLLLKLESAKLSVDSIPFDIYSNS